MIDRLEIFASGLRRLVSRNRWSARLLGHAPAMGQDDAPGLVLVQIDGLGVDVFRRAVESGRMPFLRHLIEDEGYDLSALYSGMPSSTPGFQAELFYGIPTAVPAFAYRDTELDRVLSLNDPPAARAVEARLREASCGLLRGGSAWSNIFSGDAAESHLCASTAGLNVFLRALAPSRLIGLVLWYGWSILRIAANLVAETLLAIWDFIQGTLAGRDLVQELRFVPLRVAVTAVMREMVIAGASIDAERGLPIIHLNLLAYDEHAHRRGPDSRFARWTLSGIDRAIRRVWLAAHRSRQRDYQVWIFSDHGQERTVPYPLRYGETVGDAVKRVYRDVVETEVRKSDLRASRERSARAAHLPERSLWLRAELARRPAGSGNGGVAKSKHGAEGTQGVRSDPLSTTREPAPTPPTGESESAATGAPSPIDEPTVVHQGPVGFVYLPADFDRENLERLATSITRDASIPMVLAHDGNGGAWVWRGEGPRLQLPKDAAEVFGEDHPHLESVTEDSLRIVCHQDAGSLVLMGWNRDEPMSLQFENGAHGGPGPRETSAGLLLPPELNGSIPTDRSLRPAELRDLALRVLSGQTAKAPDASAGPSPCPDGSLGDDGGSETACLRLMTYNVHGCRGMDGKYSAQRISRVISRVSPDIICLQELDDSRRRSGGIDQAGEIAAQLRAEYHFHAVAEVDDGRFGNAILSAYPMELRATGRLPRGSGILNLEDRGVLWVTIEVGGCRLQVFNTHLSIREHERRIQARELVGPRWLGHPDLQGPVLLAGDFNASVDSPTATTISRILQNVRDHHPEDPVQPTWSGRIPVRRIDHVFVSSEIEVRGSRVPRTRLSRVASDHLPLVVDLALRTRVKTGV